MAKIEVKKADIFEQEVDVIVNPANEHMRHGGGLARLIATRGGQSVVEESEALAPIQTGAAITTTAGNLPFKAVVHAVGPMWGVRPDAESDQLLYAANRSAVQQAALHGYESLAMPAISCGIFGYPVTRAAPIALRAIQDGLNANPEFHDVVICLMQDDHYRAFINAMGGGVAIVAPRTIPVRTRRRWWRRAIQNVTGGQRRRP